MRRGLSYPGNLGVMEMAQFFRDADEDQVARMDAILEQDPIDEAAFRELIAEVTGVELFPLTGRRTMKARFAHRGGRTVEIGGNPRTSKKAARKRASSFLDIDANDDTRSIRVAVVGVESHLAAKVAASVQRHIGATDMFDTADGREIIATFYGSDAQAYVSALRIARSTGRTVTLSRNGGMMQVFPPIYPVCDTCGKTARESKLGKQRVLACPDYLNGETDHICVDNGAPVTGMGSRIFPGDTYVLSRDVIASLVATSADVSEVTQLLESITDDFDVSDQGSGLGFVDVSIDPNKSTEATNILEDAGYMVEDNGAGRDARGPVHFLLVSGRPQWYSTSRSSQDNLGIIAAKTKLTVVSYAYPTVQVLDGDIELAVLAADLVASGSRAGEIKNAKVLASWGDDLITLYGTKSKLILANGAGDQMVMKEYASVETAIEDARQAADDIEAEEVYEVYMDVDALKDVKLITSRKRGASADTWLQIAEERKPGGVPLKEITDEYFPVGTKVETITAFSMTANPEQIYAVGDTGVVTENTGSEFTVKMDKDDEEVKFGWDEFLDSYDTTEFRSSRRKKADAASTITSLLADLDKALTDSMYVDALLQNVSDAMGHGEFGSALTEESWDKMESALLDRDLDRIEAILKYVQTTANTHVPSDPFTENPTEILALIQETREDEDGSLKGDLDQVLANFLTTVMEDDWTAKLEAAISTDNLDEIAAVLTDMQTVEPYASRVLHYSSRGATTAAKTSYEWAPVPETDDERAAMREWVKIVEDSVGNVVDHDEKMKDVAERHNLTFEELHMLAYGTEPTMMASTHEATDLVTENPTEILALIQRARDDEDGTARDELDRTLSNFLTTVMEDEWTSKLESAISTDSLDDIEAVLTAMKDVEPYASRTSSTVRVASYGPEEAAGDDDVTYHIRLEGSYLANGNPPTDLNTVFPEELLARVEDAESKESTESIYYSWDAWEWWTHLSEAGRQQALESLAGSELNILSVGAEMLCELDWYTISNIIRRITGGWDEGDQAVNDLLKPEAEADKAVSSTNRVYMYFRLKGTVAASTVLHLLDKTAGWSYADIQDNFGSFASWWGPSDYYDYYDCCSPVSYYGKKHGKKLADMVGPRIWIASADGEEQHKNADFMEPVTMYDTWVVGYAYSGGFVLPSELTGLPTNKDPESEEFQTWLDSIRDYVEGDDIYEDEIYFKEGWCAQLSAPGYMDQTDWVGPYDSEEEAENELQQLYGSVQVQDNGPFLSRRNRRTKRAGQTSFSLSPDTDIADLAQVLTGAGIPDSDYSLEGDAASMTLWIQDEDVERVTDLLDIFMEGSGGGQVTDPPFLSRRNRRTKRAGMYPGAETGYDFSTDIGQDTVSQALQEAGVGSENFYFEESGDITTLWVRDEYDDDVVRVMDSIMEQAGGLVTDPFLSSKSKRAYDGEDVVEAEPDDIVFDGTDAYQKGDIVIEETYDGAWITSDGTQYSGHNDKVDAVEHETELYGEATGTDTDDLSMSMDEWTRWEEENIIPRLTRVETGFRVKSDGRIFEDRDEAIKHHMENDQFYPNVWIQDDHGGMEMITISRTRKQMRATRVRRAQDGDEVAVGFTILFAEHDWEEDHPDEDEISDTQYLQDRETAFANVVQAIESAIPEVNTQSGVKETDDHGNLIYTVSMPKSSLATMEDWLNSNDMGGYALDTEVQYFTATEWVLFPTASIGTDTMIDIDSGWDEYTSSKKADANETGSPRGTAFWEEYKRTTVMGSTESQASVNIWESNENGDQLASNPYQDFASAEEAESWLDQEGYTEVGVAGGGVLFSAPFTDGPGETYFLLKDAGNVAELGVGGDPSDMDFPTISPEGIANAVRILNENEGGGATVAPASLYTFFDADFTDQAEIDKAVSEAVSQGLVNDDGSGFLSVAHKRRASIAEDFESELESAGVQQVVVEMSDKPGYVDLTIDNDHAQTARDIGADLGLILEDEDQPYVPGTLMDGTSTVMMFKISKDAQLEATANTEVAFEPYDWGGIIKVQTPSYTMTAGWERNDYSSLETFLDALNSGGTFTDWDEQTPVEVELLDDGGAKISSPSYSDELSADVLSDLKNYANEVIRGDEY